ncbi:b4galnt2: putative protein [Crotalus adamanteus]|uniref:Uncharacterized protein n=1 Tax=Crotalus adamanteus TaxID=8729 RepID=A0AAW1B4W9_CROAD
MQVLLQASFGNLNTLADVSEEVVQGRGTKELIITTSYVKLLNHILKHVTYTSTKYLLDVVDMRLVRREEPCNLTGHNQILSLGGDDFNFTEKTKIQKLVDVLENSNLDVIGHSCHYSSYSSVCWHNTVGGSVDGNEYKFKFFYEEGEDSSCLHLRSGFYHHLEGFPNCVVTSSVVNFFLAHTEESRHVGFDPKLQRVAHLEYFMDGLGSLQIGSCNDVIIGHQSHLIYTNIQEANVEKLYRQFWNNCEKEIRFKLSLHYFKNRMLFKELIDSFKSE